MNCKLVTALLLITCTSYAQSKSELKQEIADLKTSIGKLQADATTVTKEKESLKTKLDRISTIAIDDVITADEQPSNITVGEGGWRVDLNGTKYKSDILGQLGTLWILDSAGQLQPQGAVALTKHNIKPTMINEGKDVLYRKFVSKGTTLQGDGGAPFAKITGSLKNDQFSEFTISIDGTSQILPEFGDLQKIGVELTNLFTLATPSKVYMCTGMHVVRYHSKSFAKSVGDTKITSPVVNIDGSFYADNGEEAKEFFVARQLTEIWKPIGKDSTAIKTDVNNIVRSTSTSNIPVLARLYAPSEALTGVLKRAPTSQEMMEFESDPDKFINKLKALNWITGRATLMLEEVSKKIKSLPTSITTVDK